MSRWKAAGIHFLISLFIAILALIVMLLIIYPWEYFQAGGGAGLLLILVGVDVTLGPLLTLIIFRQGKPGLKFDLSMIGLFQLLALLYGLSVIINVRPVFLVFSHDRFELVTANAVVTESLERAKYPEFSSLSWTGPRLAYAARPKDSQARSEILWSALQGHGDLENHPEFFQPYQPHRDEVLRRAKTLDEVMALNPETENALRETGKNLDPEDKLVYMPLRATKSFMTIALDRQSAEIRKIIPIDPW